MDSMEPRYLSKDLYLSQPKLAPFPNLSVEIKKPMYNSWKSTSDNKIIPISPQDYEKENSLNFLNRDKETNLIRQKYSNEKSYKSEKKESSNVPSSYREWQDNVKKNEKEKEMEEKNKGKLIDFGKQLLNDYCETTMNEFDQKIQNLSQQIKLISIQQENLPNTIECILTKLLFEKSKEEHFPKSKFNETRKIVKQSTTTTTCDVATQTNLIENDVAFTQTTTTTIITKNVDVQTDDDGDNNNKRIENVQVEKSAYVRNDDDDDDVEHLMTTTANNNCLVKSHLSDICESSNEYDVDDDDDEQTLSSITSSEDLDNDYMSNIKNNTVKKCGGGGGGDVEHISYSIYKKKYGGLLKPISSNDYYPKSRNRNDHSFINHHHHHHLDQFGSSYVKTREYELLQHGGGGGGIESSINRKSKISRILISEKEQFIQSNNSEQKKLLTSRLHSQHLNIGHFLKKYSKTTTTTSAAFSTRGGD